MPGLNYRRFDRFRTTRADLMNRKVPELFILHVFHKVALALYELQTGNLYQPYNDEQRTASQTAGYNQEDFDLRKDPRWVPLLHRDLKSANVFLKTPTEYDGYPVPVLADFDLATRIFDEDGNTIKPTVQGTPGYVPPEQIQQSRDNHPKAQIPLTVRADIWNLGGVMWDLTHSLMASYVDDVRKYMEVCMHDPAFDNVFRDDQSTLETMLRGHDLFQDPDYLVMRNDPKDRSPKYTRVLTELINKCCMHSPTQRPNPRQVVEATQKALDDMKILIEGDVEVEGARLPFGYLRPWPDEFTTGRRHQINRRRIGEER